MRVSTELPACRAATATGLEPVPGNGAIGSWHRQFIGSLPFVMGAIRASRSRQPQTRLRFFDPLASFRRGEDVEAHVLPLLEAGAALLKLIK